MALKRIVAPTLMPISLSEAKAHCRVDHTDDDTIIGLYIQAAVDHTDAGTGLLGRAMINQTWELTHDAFPCGPLKIELGPLQSVSSVQYIDPVTGLYVTWPGSNYQVDLASYEGWIAPIDSWPTAKDAMNAVKIVFIAGYGDAAANVPANVRAAMLMLVGHWYQNRESVAEPGAMNLPLTYHDLIGTVRKQGI
jgi:uncharacterized phiE125 gp8 family phage protein